MWNDSSNERGEKGQGPSIGMVEGEGWKIVNLRGEQLMRRVDAL